MASQFQQQNQVPSAIQKLSTPQLPISQLESLRFKANQIIESIESLYAMLEGRMYPEYMPSWPELLSKYNVILSQTQNFSNSLVNPFPAARAQQQQQQQSEQENIFQKIVMHPNVGITDAQMDGEIGPLLRNQQTMSVLKQENETVRRLSEHMSTRGMLGVLGITGDSAAQPNTNGFGGHYIPPPRKPEYEDVIQECTEIRDAHDHLVDRAVKAVALLRDKYEWKARVEVEVEEPEELDWDPRYGVSLPPPQRHLDEDVGMESDSSGDDEDDQDEADVEQLMDRPEDMEGRTPGAELFGSTAEGESTRMEGIS
jgi:hypothetical protein